MGMEYIKIHACPNDCILYRKEFEKHDHCPKCKVSRYKKKDDDQEMMRAQRVLLPKCFGTYQ